MEEKTNNGERKTEKQKEEIRHEEENTMVKGK
jgi:hypothetical protein